MIATATTTADPKAHVKSSYSLSQEQKDQTIEEMREGRQFLKYTFFKLLPSWRTIEPEAREIAKLDFKLAVNRYSERMIVKTFSLLGTRGDTDFMIWTISERLEDFQELVSSILSGSMGKHLAIPYSYLSMTRRSEYIRDHKHPGQEGDSLKKIPGDAKYLFVYPFVKKREWYSLPMEERQRMMLEHIRVGHKYPSVKINTSYSFGLDDQEFVLSFESDYPSDFLELVNELRSSDTSKYTAVETPLFTCVSASTEELLQLI